MAGIWSTQFAATNGVTQDYVVPAGRVAIIRCITATNADTSTARNWNVNIRSPFVYIAYAKLSPTRSTISPFFEVIDMRVVVNAGQMIRAEPEVNVSLTVSGYLFAL